MVATREIAAESVISYILPKIQGPELELELIELSRFGGKLLSDGRRSVTRLAFSDEDFAARRYLGGEMVRAGMYVQNTPLAVVGLYPGTTDNAPVETGSHHDSVENGGPFDGAVGVICAINIVRQLHEGRVRLPRPIRVISYTGEESARFQLALMGSKGMYFGLTEQEATSHRPGDITIAQAIRAHFPSYDYTRPFFGPLDKPYASLELHVSQDRRLADKGMDLAIVEAIAAPERLQIEIGSPLALDTREYAYSRYLKTTISGIADHSGATPMGSSYRADGLVAWARFLSENFRRFPEMTIGSVEPTGQALNKIPGLTNVVLRFAGENALEVDEAIDLFQKLATLYGKRLAVPGSRFKEDPISVQEVSGDGVKFFSARESMSHHLQAATAIKVINGTAGLYGSENIVGTVGTFHITSEGKILLGVDIRGIDLGIRNTVVGMIQSQINSEYGRDDVRFHRLAGSDEPTKLDSHLANLIYKLTKENKIASVEKTYSPAGHDIQTVTKRHPDIPTGLIFTASRNEGVSHSPSEYSTAQDLENGGKALAATVITLGCQ